MAFNAAGVFSRLYNWVADRDAGINITASRVDAETDGIVAGLNQVVDGTQPIKAPVRGAYGTAAAPGHSFDGDEDTGIYRPASDQLAGTEGGTDLGRLYGRKNIVGTVAQTGGVPTGSVIEQGSNANGAYARYADGTQVCWVKQFDLNYSSAAFVERTWTFPAAFISSTITVTASHFYVATQPSGMHYNKMGGVVVGSPTSTNIAIRAYSSAGNSFGSSDVFPVSAMAIGRWF